MTTMNKFTIQTTHDNASMINLTDLKADTDVHRYYVEELLSKMRFDAELLMIDKDNYFIAYEDNNAFYALHIVDDYVICNERYDTLADATERLMSIYKVNHEND